jgi:hypothetical protein
LELVKAHTHRQAESERTENNIIKQGEEERSSLHSYQIKYTSSQKQKRKRRLLYSSKGNNPSRRWNNCKFTHTKY